MSETLERQVRLLMDRQEILDVLQRYCRAIDRLDLDLLKTIYHPDASDAHGMFDGNAHAFAEFIIAHLRETVTYGFHTITQALIDLDGDRAASEAYYVGYHRIAGDKAKLSSFFGPSFAEHAEAEGHLGKEHEYECGGRYIDAFERRDGVWRVARRAITNEWSRCKVTSHIWHEGEVSAVNLPGKRDRSDLVYASQL